MCRYFNLWQVFFFFLAKLKTYVKQSLRGSFNKSAITVLQNIWDFRGTDEEPLINIAQAVCQYTNADRPVLVIVDGPTYINMSEDTGELSSGDKLLVNIAKASQQIGTCSSPEVVTINDLKDSDWHEDTVQLPTSEDDGKPLICLIQKNWKQKKKKFPQRTKNTWSCLNIN